MKSYFSSLILCLLCVAGLVFSGPLQAGQNPVSPSAFQQDSLHAAAASKPAPVPAKEAPNWPALASQMAFGAEVLMILFWSSIAGAFSLTTLATAFAPMIVIGCFSMIYGLIRLRKMKKSHNTDVAEQKKMRQAVLWGSIAGLIPIFLLSVYMGFILLLGALIDI